MVFLFRKKWTSEKKGVPTVQQSRYARLAKLTELIHSELDLFTMLEQIVMAITEEVVQCDAISIFLPGRDGVFQGTVGKPTRLNGISVQELQIDPAQDVFAQELISTKKSIYIPDTSVDPRPNRAVIEALDIQAILGLPIVYDGHLHGLVFLHQINAEMPLSAQEVQTVESFVSMAAVAIRNANLFTAQRALLFEKELLLDATRRLSLCSSTYEVVETGLRFLREALGKPSIGLELYDACKKRVQAVKKGCNGVVWEQKEQSVEAELFWADLQANMHPVFLAEADAPVGTLVLPLIATGEFLGAFTVYEYEASRFHLQGPTDIAQSLVDVTATAFANLTRMEQLEGIVQARTAELQEKNRVLEEAIAQRDQSEEMLKKKDKLALVGQLAAGVAHEIRNPLASIRGFVQLMQEGMHSERYLEIMLSELDRIEEIISEFLVLAKPQAVKFALCDVRGLLENVVVLFETQATLNNVRIETDFAPDLPLMLGKENQLKQLFINLLKNATEAMADVPDALLQMEARPLGEDHLRIRIVDQGCGISPHRLKKLGEPFYTTKEKGTGLGLMVSYKIVEDHQGTIQIESEPGQGTTVTLTFPCREATVSTS